MATERRQNEDGGGEPTRAMSGAGETLAGTIVKKRCREEMGREGKGRETKGLDRRGDKEQGERNIRKSEGTEESTAVISTSKEERNVSFDGNRSLRKQISDNSL